MFRFALLPTHDITMGNLRVALINYIYAKQHDDKFIIRIDSVEKTKNIEINEAEILDILKICGISYDALYHQSDNFKYHLQFASKLLDEKKAFICFCTPEELKIKQKQAEEAFETYQYDGTCEHLSSETILNSTKPFVIRIKRTDHDIKVHDGIQGELNFEKQRIDSFIIMKEDKYPTYDFACAIDDMIQGVSHIIQEQGDHLSAPKQEYIRETLGYKVPITYTSLPEIFYHDREKIHKKESKSVRWFLDHGYLPEAIVNYLIALSYKTPQENFTLQEAIQWFNIKKVSQTETIFDIKTLDRINQAHLVNKNNLKEKNQ